MPALIVPFGPKHLKELTEIFFESSTRKEFANVEARDVFFYKYVGYYLEHYPEYCLVAWDKRVLGYVLGAPETTGDIFRIQPHLEYFKAEYARFPAHLHMNCHHEARGQGIGGQLVEGFVKLLSGPGLHIMTGPESLNKNFYRKHSFSFENVSHDILFMGRPL